MFEIMSKRCDGNGSHQHQRLEGRNRCHRAENLVRALLLDEGLHEQVYAVSEDAAPLTGALRKLASNHGHEAARIAQRLHRNLGHPRKEVLLHALRSRNCSPKVLAAVQDLKCPFCEIHSVKKGNAPGHLDRPTEFNTQLQADVLWLDLKMKLAW